MARAHQQQRTAATRFECHTSAARAVFLAGTFNGWDPTATPMIKDANGNWDIAVALAPGRHEFKFVVDGVWCCEPGCEGPHHGCPKCVSNSFGTMNRLIEVVKVVDLTEGAYIERELMMVKVRAVGKEREEMKRMADIFRGRIIDVTEKSYTIELTGDQAKNDAFLDAIERSAILETVRTGSSGVGRGERILRV